MNDRMVNFSAVLESGKSFRKDWQSFIKLLISPQHMSIILTSISIFFFITVFITRIRHDYWIFRVLEYPRLQKLMLIAIVMILWFGIFPLATVLEYVSFCLLLISAVYLLYKIYPYTTVCKKEMKGAAEKEQQRLLKLFTANVYQDNRNYDKLLEQIRSENPDLVFLVETDDAWCKAVSVLKKDYPYSLVYPLENTYGLAFYSRIPLDSAMIRFLVKDEIPSLEAVITWGGSRILLIGLHPEPPVPGENLYSTAKDKELMKVALKVKECNCPCIVFGDLNDVAWSHTTELFRKASRLLDPRIGRGFYSTFSAKIWFMRFPLDYVFCSDHFHLADMKRLPENGSDHFATSTSLVLAPEKDMEQEAPRADNEELKEVRKKALEVLPENE